MKNTLPVLVILASVGFLFQDKIKETFIPGEQVVVDEVDVSESLKEKVSGVVAVVQKSEAKKDTKKKASDLWKASGDMWALSDADFNSNELVAFNTELLVLYGKKYPDLANAFPGFSEAMNSVFSEVIGEYPTPMTKEKLKELSELCYAIAWAFEQ